MHQLGFASDYRGKINPVYFFSRNIPGFCRLWGLEPIEANCIVRKSNSPDHIVFSVKGRKVSLCNGERTNIPQCDLSFYINQYLLSLIQKGDQTLLHQKLWYYLAFYLRLLAIHLRRLCDADLVPSSVLCHMDYTEEIQQEFIEIYSEKIWNETELFRHYDAAVVGYHVAELMMSDGVISKLHEREIAEVIWNIEERNHKKFLSQN